MVNLPKIRIIGLTGMSGAGKSTVCRHFSENGYLVIDCDKSAREVAEAGSPFLRELSERISPELLKPDGTLDRRLTAELIFSDSGKRVLYNKIIYPYITYNVIEKIKGAEGSVLLDAPTLFEARLEGLCTHIVSVCADTDICVKRITARDNISAELAEARLSSQHSADFFREHSDFFIENNGTEQQLFEAAKKITEQLKGNQ